AARPAYSVDFAYWASSRIMAPSNCRVPPSGGDLRGRNEAPNLLQVFAADIGAVRFCLRVDTGRPHRGNCCGDILAVEPTGANCRTPPLIDIASADAPVGRTTEPADLAVAGIMAVKQQKVGDPLICSRPLDAGFVEDRYRPHDQDAREFGFERPRI